VPESDTSGGTTMTEKSVRRISIAPNVAERDGAVYRLA